MISRTVEYALRAVVFLAAQAPRPATAERVANATKVGKPYLAKVLHLLDRAGIVIARRGKGGGVSLARDPQAISILDIVNAVDPIPRIRRCPLDLEAHGTRLCPLHHRLDKALAGIEKAFAASTLAEILAEPTQSIPLCPFPPNITTLQAGAANPAE